MQQLTVTCKGLYTAPNPFSGVPPGAMLVANNGVIDSENIFESRRGFDRLSILPDHTARTNRIDSFGTLPFVMYGDGTSFSVANYDSTFTTYSGTYNHPDPNLARGRFFQANQNLYWTSDEGIFKLDSTGNEPVPAGMFPALDLAVSVTGSSGNVLGQGTITPIQGYTTSGSTTLSGIPNLSGISPGQSISGTDIPTSTTVSSINIAAGSLILSKTATGTTSTATTIRAGILVNSTQMVGVSNLTGIVAGNFVQGQGISLGTTVSAIDSTNNIITLSSPATQSNVVLQSTGTVTSGSTTVAFLSSTQGLVAGQFVTGTGISPGTTISSINANGTVAITGVTCSTTIASNSVTAITGTTQPTVGQLVTGVGIAAGSYVGSTGGISGAWTITLVTQTGQAQFATATGTTVAVVFSLSGSIILSSAAGSPATNPGTVTNITVFSASTSYEFTFYDATQIWNCFTGSQTAYRQVWGIKDANNNVLLGAPSGRTVVTNTEPNTVDTTLTFTIPTGITTAYFYQVYRTLQSGDSTIDPGDNEQLVAEGNPLSSDISNGFITITDVTPDSLLGADLYTNQNQQGAGQAYYQPPIAWDVATFRNYTFYANTTSKQNLTLTLLSAGAGGSTSVAVGDVLTISGVAYTAGNSQVPSTGTFQVFTAGTTAQNIANTAQGLCTVINQYAASAGATTPVYATYQSGSSGLPGQILLQERGLGGVAFSVTVSAHGGAWNPTLPTSGTSVQSTNNVFGSFLSYSAAGLPEAVPLTNTYPVGSASNRIMRIFALRDALLILKENEGVYALTGYDPTSFNITLVDSSARILAPDSAAILNNQVFALTDQGITTITSTGCSVVSRPVETSLLMAYGANNSGYKYFSSGIGYETDRKYVLLTVTESGDTFNTQAFVYNFFTQTFTIWPLSKTCGFVNPIDDKLYFGDALTAYVNIERKSYNRTDYADEEITGFYTVSGSSGAVISLNTVSDIAVGDLLYQSTTNQSPILSINYANNSVTLESSLTGWTTGAVSLFKSIPVLAQWAPVSVSNPGTMKQCPEISLIFRNQSFNSALLNFTSDIIQSEQPVTIEGSTSGLWGIAPFGEFPWGGVLANGPIRTLIPQQVQRCSELNIQFQIQQANCQFQLLGMSIPIPPDETYTVAR